MVKVSTAARMALVAAVALTAAACGGSDGATTAEVTTTTTAVAAATTAAASGGSAASTPVTSAPPTTAPATTAPATTAPAPTAPPAAAGLTLECLQGEWILDQATTDRFISALVPFAPASVPAGSISMRFEGDRVTYYTNIVVRFTVPSGAVEAPLDLRQVGTATVAGSELRISGVETTGGWGSFTGTVGGVSVNVPAPPVGDVPTLAGGPATCRGDRFTLQYTSALADAVAEFVRA